jgi:hypothetical protein
MARALGRFCLTALTVVAAGAAMRAQPASAACGSWQRVPGAPVHGRLLDVSASSATDVWAVGQSRHHTLAERWDGSGWQRFRTPNPRRGTDTLTAVVAITPQDAWAAGSYGRFVDLCPFVSDGRATTQSRCVVSRPLLAHWDGAAWRRWTLPDSARHAQLYDLAATSRTDVWAVGESRRGLPRVLHFDGSSWSVVPIGRPTGGGLSGLQAIAATSPSDAWSVGWRSSRSTLTEHWGGGAWHQVRNPGKQGGPFQPASVAATSRQDAWAVVGGVGGSTIIHWDGSAWTTAHSANENILSIGASGPSDAWAVGLQGGFPSYHPATLHWDGTSWLRTVLPQHNAQLSSVTHVPAGTAYWAVGDVMRGGHGQPVYFTPLLESYC